MRILIWHGYLLGGTGSNVYTRSLARTWARQGHDVVVLCQDPHPELTDLGGAEVVRPQLDGQLPVFVLDRYEDADPVLLGEMDEAARQRFVEVNAAAVRAQLPADLVLVNHVLLGAPVGAASGAPFVVKAHGSELEFAMRDAPDLQRWGRETLDQASAVIAGSDHIVAVLDAVVGAGPHSSRTVVIPPGVDVELLRPRARDAALRDLISECEMDPPNPADRHDERRPDEGNAGRLAIFLEDPAPTVLFVGKISEEKGVPLLIEALRAIDARAVIVGFGPARAELERDADDRVLFTGPLEHRHLAHLWPLADVAVTPSLFPEAFGMVAAEAAACGCPPLVARHSGLAEIAARLETTYPSELAHLVGFERGDVEDLRSKLAELFALSPDDRRRISEAARATAVDAWSWDSVADRIAQLAEA
ncbi:MAG: glycosyltransferase family 4 protein [Nitriliruptor sp.]|uniref:glycosyltransferase family 4 protein n=1 Tax=Nitriliruptor sp. TaxID=2448056 RepID=UPI0034A073C4